MLTAVLLLALQLPEPATGPAPYWQQRADYAIAARLDEPTGTLGGTQVVRYRNNSPDTLRTIAFHLYLNAFRPGSRWADADSAEGRRRFNDLRDPDFGRNTIANVRVDEFPVLVEWPFAPDSTIARLRLRTPIPPGGTATITMDWTARPSTLPRRQGRRGRHYDFAQWYPRVAVYDKLGWQEHPLYPAGEFYGEFGSFDVTLDVPADQVLGATGVVTCGDPGWRTANRGAGPAANIREPRAAGWQAPPCAGTAARDRKLVRWYANDVHHFGLTMSPDYRYEGGEHNGTAIHVLYQPGDTATWGRGVVVGHTAQTLRFLEGVFGAYPWPQMTVVHRIEGGGTEFPMMQMNGEANEWLNVHEGAHNYLMGILASNEWREGWIDEGGASFLTSLFAESKGMRWYTGLERDMVQLDLDGWSEPASMVSEDYRDLGTYGAMVYGKGELFWHQLRHAIGDDAFRRTLRLLFERWKFRHVDEAAIRGVAEEASGRDLAGFFAQWLHGTELTDYAVGTVARREVFGGWETTIEVRRKGGRQFPVTVAVFAEGDTTRVMATGRAERERVVVRTGTKPRRVRLDPDVISGDWNHLNNQRTLGFTPERLIGPDQPTEHYLDLLVNARTRRDRRTVGWLPAVWYNDVGGLTIGARTRDDYLGRFEQHVTLFSGGTGVGVDDPVTDFDMYAKFVNPVWWRVPHLSQSLETFRMEGRSGAALTLERRKPTRLGGPTTRTVGGELRWLATHETRYLDADRWTNGGTGELALWAGVTHAAGPWALGVTARVAGGVQYGREGEGLTTEKRYDAQAYVRPEFTATMRRTLGARTTLGLQLFGGAVLADAPVLPQRRFFASGAGPYATLGNPFIRSIGAPLVGSDMLGRFHAPGDGNLRGIASGLSTEALATLNVELEHALVSRTGVAALSRIDVVGFADAGVLGDIRGPAGTTESLALLVAPDRWLADAGVGVRFTHRIGKLAWRTRIELPLWVSQAAYAATRTRDRFDAGRWLIAFSPVLR
ncbi:MAG TPA: M1 family metallopeptidase [Gemmatimonadales bacterium]|nr:M1 family metallopeptidase [Gemmatimonadales bacterium]